MDYNYQTGKDNLWDFGASKDYPLLKADFDGYGIAAWWEFGEQHDNRVVPTPMPNPTATNTAMPTSTPTPTRHLRRPRCLRLLRRRRTHPRKRLSSAHANRYQHVHAHAHAVRHRNANPHDYASAANLHARSHGNARANGYACAAHSHGCAHRSACPCNSARTAHAGSRSSGGNCNAIGGRAVRRRMQLAERAAAYGRNGGQPVAANCAADWDCGDALGGRRHGWHGSMRSYSDYTTSPPSGAFTSMSTSAYHAAACAKTVRQCWGTVDYESESSVPPDIFTSLSTDGSGGYHTCGLREGRHIGIMGMADAVARQPAAIALQ